MITSRVGIIPVLISIMVLAPIMLPGTEVKSKLKNTLANTHIVPTMHQVLYINSFTSEEGAIVILIVQKKTQKHREVK